ncbi:MAG: copper homeostasis protein CutC [Bacteroidales bacterium]|nr:copper homeostasis protein CutC [Bacteroidales bacterium]
MEVEICCNSKNSARNAQEGGATRIELCRNLEVGGLTPCVKDIIYCKKELGLRVHVLVRPREGDFCYNAEELDTIRREIDVCRESGADAVVLGFLTRDGRIDEELTREMVHRAEGMEVTFHRAFDEISQDPIEALEAVIRCGCHRLLTSGCHCSAWEGRDVIKDLVRQAQGRIKILAGAGITPANVRDIIDYTCVTEVHGSCKHTLSDGTIETDAVAVRDLLRQAGLEPLSQR